MRSALAVLALAVGATMVAAHPAPLSPENRKVTGGPGPSAPCARLLALDAPLVRPGREPRPGL